MTTNQQLFETALEVAEKLDQTLGVKPVVYGSLGLYRVIDVDKQSNDVDLMIPEKYFSDLWDELVSCMEGAGFLLANKDKREFERDGIAVGFDREEDLPEFSGIDGKQLIEKEHHRELNAEQYLKVYTWISGLPHRSENKKKADQEKIGLIKSFLENN